MDLVVSCMCPVSTLVNSWVVVVGIYRYRTRLNHGRYLHPELLAPVLLRDIHHTATFATTLPSPLSKTGRIIYGVFGLECQGGTTGTYVGDYSCVSTTHPIVHHGPGCGGDTCQVSDRTYYVGWYGFF